MVNGGCITINNPGESHKITFSAGAKGIYLTIDSEGVMHIAPGLSPDEATQAVARMLVEQWGKAYGLKVWALEEQIKREKLIAKKAVTEMESWRSAARKAGRELKARHEKKLTADDLDDDDDNDEPAAPVT